MNNKNENDIKLWNYDISKAIEIFRHQKKKKLIELYLIRQGFNYDEEESEDLTNLTTRTIDDDDDDGTIVVVYCKDIKITTNPATKIKFKIKIELYMNCHNEIGFYWLEGFNFSMYDYELKFPETENLKFHLLESVTCPKKIKYMDREIYLLKRLKIILETLA